MSHQVVDQKLRQIASSSASTVDGHQGHDAQYAPAIFAWQQLFESFEECAMASHEAIAEYQLLWKEQAADWSCHRTRQLLVEDC